MTTNTVLAVSGGLVVVVVLAFQLTWMDDPWDGSQGGEISGALTEYSCKAFDAHGWVELGGRPAHFFLPWDASVFRPLDHHPPAPFLAYYGAWRGFGRGPAALRALSLLLLMVSLGAVMCAGRLVAPGAGAASVAFLAAAPAKDSCVFHKQYFYNSLDLGTFICGLQTGCPRFPGFEDILFVVYKQNIQDSMKLQ